ncbi:MAG: hypothetical protein ACXWNG_06100 [Candidatus Limnocylindrales bacterium]
MRPALDPAVAVAAAAAEPTQPCLRCGAPISLDDALCERCNPLGLPQPAASQAHGTLFLAIALSVIALAIVGRFAVNGVGPFSGQVMAVAAAPPGLEVTITVRNGGTSAGATTCRVFDPSEPGIGPDSGYLLSPQIRPGGAVTFSGLVTTLGPNFRPLGADCR